MGAVPHRFGIGDGDDIDADGNGVRPDEADGFNIAHTGSFAGNIPAKDLPPKPAESRVIPGLEIHLNKSQCHIARSYIQAGETDRSTPRHAVRRGHSFDRV
ncbi:hypothetical protein GCM10023346_06460 [Arthrobacter gyeryongensis]|uniref:Uncharacterized protein n=1 Tax=Arthrobacter gyeryongensis TaxID=1650592 RepID=A0ABP9S2Q1_9MICC